jgi:hypothetical protein
MPITMTVFVSIQPPFFNVREIQTMTQRAAASSRQLYHSKKVN